MMRHLLLAGLVWLLLTPLLPAHPVPKDNHDRTLVVRLTPEAVVVEYRLEVDETTGALELPKAEIAGITTRKELHAALSRYLADVLADNLVATLDGKQLTFRCVRRSHLVSDHVRCDYRFEAHWAPQARSEHKFTFRESNYELDDFSSLRLRVSSDSRLKLVTVDAPSEVLMARPGTDRKPGEGERLRTATATFTLAATEAAGVYKPALPPDPDLTRLEAVPTTSAAILKLPPSTQSGFDKPFQETRVEEPEADLPPSKNVMLGLLLNSDYGLVLLLFLAALFGAAHALTPGHGKTLVAAYLVGERGTIWHALLLGVVTTLTHTGAVLILAALLPAFFPTTPKASIQAVLGLAGGLLIAGLGIWLLLRRLTGRADHVHIGGGHHGHNHGHDHGQVPALGDGKGVGLVPLIVLGIQGGIVPCWDAIAMLIFAVGDQRVWLALPLLLAFSAGLASVLIGLGISVVLARNYAATRWAKGERFRGLARALPLLSAILITAMGLWLCYESVHRAGPGH